MSFTVGHRRREDFDVDDQARRTYVRHSPRQIQILETFFNENPHPDERQRRRLGRDLGMTSRQVKFWFQNKRTQLKLLAGKADNAALRAENERILNENIAIREALNNVLCPDCGGPPRAAEQQDHQSIQNLLQENALLREEHEKVTKLISSYTGTPVGSLLMDPSIISCLPENLEVSGQEVNHDQVDDIPIHFQPREITALERRVMLETILSAKDELIQLARTNEPLWVKSSPFDETFVLHQENYGRIFPKSSRYKASNARIESSRDVGIVAMSATQLVDMFMDPEKWMDMFPTMVSDARTIQVIEPAMLDSKDGCLQMMYEQMHILSPFVPQREYYFLRYCAKIEADVWIIVDVSYDWIGKNMSPSHSSRFPSGCVIQDMPNNCAHVTWVEHVEVHDKTNTHRLYRNLIFEKIAYGAERWVLTLQRMTERVSFFISNNTLVHDVGGAISLPRGKWSIMKLAHRMLKYFNGILSMPEKLDFPHNTEANASGVRVSVHHNSKVGQPYGTIINASTSVWLPIHPGHLFNFFKDESKRTEWDILTNGNTVHEVAYISTGADPGNSIAIIKPFVPTDNSMVILQESSIDRLGSMIVYAPMDIPSLNHVASGGDQSEIPLLPSGFMISGDGHPPHHIASSSSSSSNPNNSSGSLLTAAFQVLVANPIGSKEKDMEAVASVNTLISSTVQRIKISLNCRD